MQKKVLLLIIVLVLAFPAFAGYFDVGITLGTNAHLGEKDLDPSRLKLAWGASIGLTDVWELDIQASTQLVPTFLDTTSVSFLIQRALLGQRSTGGQTAGMGINSLVGLGVMLSPYTLDGITTLSHLLVSLTPLTVGSPVIGKRERALTVTLAYNLHTKQVGVLFDLLKFDFYVVGSYKDYR
ncbi:MAG: hypothetical protein VB088_01975 [Sphaerochaeta sp.]|jgi:hypothetical protein|nr:hypothetical protein [Sphaerochaeta sp.]HAP57080.1 hypothetical protein [Sphaerochaeta sp.]